MVVKEEYEGIESFKCEECGFHYRDKRNAENCEKHCRNNDSCDTQTIKRSIEREKENI